MKVVLGSRTPMGPCVPCFLKSQVSSNSDKLRKRTIARNHFLHLFILPSTHIFFKSRRPVPPLNILLYSYSTNTAFHLASLWCSVSVLNFRLSVFTLLGSSLNSLVLTASLALRLVSLLVSSEFVALNYCLELGRRDV